MNVSVMRSPWRLTFLLVISVPAILLAVDMMVSHRWVPKPATYPAQVGSTIDDQGNVVAVTKNLLTHEGRADQRRYLASGLLLLAGGMATMGYSVTGLLRPRPILRSTAEGISVRVDGWGHPPRLLPWESILEVRSGVRDDNGAAVPVLSIMLDDPALVPVDPAGAVAEPPWLHVWAEDWDRPAHQIAPLLDPRARRRPATS